MNEYTILAEFPELQPDILADDERMYNMKQCILYGLTPGEQAVYIEYMRQGYNQTRTAAVFNVTRAVLAWRLKSITNKIKNYK